jgi:hypothetical protein
LTFDGKQIFIDLNYWESLINLNQTGLVTDEPIHLLKYGEEILYLRFKASKPNEKKDFYELLATVFVGAENTLNS